MNCHHEQRMSAHYSVYCICIHCSYQTFLQMEKSALSPEEYERRQREFDAIEERRKLREWNRLSERGDAA
jgi:hypothetical protein